VQAREGCDSWETSLLERASRSEVRYSLTEKVRELHHLGIPIFDDCNQTGARGQYGLVLIRPPPIWVQLWDSSLGRRMSKSIARTSASSSTRNGRRATVRHCRRRRACSRLALLISRNTRSYVSSSVSGISSRMCSPHLVEDSGAALPVGSTPTGTYFIIHENLSRHSRRTPYIPSALSESVSMTSFLSSSRHLRIFLSE
jgi:hypothetical protein